MRVCRMMKAFPEGITFNHYHLEVGKAGLPPLLLFTIHDLRFTIYEFRTSILSPLNSISINAAA